MSPTLNFVTPPPTAATRPTISWPGTAGYIGGIAAQWPRTKCRSLWQMPQNRISIRTSVDIGSRRGIGVDLNGAVALATA